MHARPPRVEGTQRPPFPANDKGMASRGLWGAGAGTVCGKVAAEPDRRREWHGPWRWSISPCHSPVASRPGCST
eukprot:3578540-Prymnesium_polylepis.1